MNNLKFPNATKPLLALFVLSLTPLALFAQDGAASTAKPPTVEQFAGTYKGSAKNPSSDLSLTLEIKTESGRVSGRLIESQDERQIASGEIVGGKLALKLGSGAGAATLTLQPQDDKLLGQLTSTGGQPRAIEFKKVTEPSMAEFLTGDWDAAADVQGQPFPFSLTLKVDGEKVTGASNSELGTSTITSGTWKDRKLVFVLDSPNGQIGMIATIVDGKLVGDFDLSGQMTGKWAAVKRKR